MLSWQLSEYLPEFIHVFLKLLEFVSGGGDIFLYALHDFYPHTKQNHTGQNQTG
jgi:hypothetical protein